jgi:hypothetical protein
MLRQSTSAGLPAERLLQSPLPDYLVPGVSNHLIAGVLAGAVGLIVTGSLLWMGFSALRQKHSGSSS